MDMQKEKHPLSVADIARRFNRTPGCVRKWITRGLSTGNGGRKKLKATQFGAYANWMIDEADLQAFMTGEANDSGPEAEADKQNSL